MDFLPSRTIKLSYVPCLTTSHLPETPGVCVGWEGLSVFSGVQALSFLVDSFIEI